MSDDVSPRAMAKELFDVIGDHMRPLADAVRRDKQDIGWLQKELQRTREELIATARGDKAINYISNLERHIGELAERLRVIENKVR